MTFTSDEIPEAVAIKLVEMRTEMRAEFEAEIAKLRAELLANAPARPPDTKWKPVPVPDAMIA